MATETTKIRDAKWFWDKIARKQSNAMLRQLEFQPLPEGVNPKDVLDTCLRDHGGTGRPSVTTVDEKILLRYLGDGKFRDEDIRDVLVHASAYAVIQFHRKRPDLLPADRIYSLIEAEALELIRQHFEVRRQNDKRLAAFVRRVESIPGFAEIIAVHHVHGS